MIESTVIPFENADSIETYLHYCKNQRTLYLTDDMMFKIVAICLMSTKEVQGVVAITLAILSQLLQCSVTKLQENIMNMATPTNTREVDAYSSKLENAEEGRASSGRENNAREHKEEKDSTISVDNNLSDSKENKIGKPSSDNGVASNESGAKKTSRDKSKSLLSKLRRCKRKTSSDSDAGDLEITR